MEYNRKVLCYVLLALQAFIICGMMYSNWTTTIWSKGFDKSQYSEITLLKDTIKSNNNTSRGSFVEEDNNIGDQVLGSTPIPDELKNLIKARNTSLPICPPESPLLVGYKNVDLVSPAATEKLTEERNPLVSNGGHYKPENCEPVDKIAIIIPFRNRDTHLLYFLQYMHPILQKQQLEYKIYVVNQVSSSVSFIYFCVFICLCCMFKSQL